MRFPPQRPGLLAVVAVSAIVLAGPAMSLSAMEEQASECLPASGQTRIGAPAPWLSGWTLDNQVFNITRPFRDESVRRLALVFWATHCGPCRDGIKRLEAAAPALVAAGTRVALVNVGDQAAQVAEFVAGFFPQGVPPFAVVLDPHAVQAAPYFGEAITLPLTVVIERGGTVRQIIRAKGNDYVALLLASDPQTD